MTTARVLCQTVSHLKSEETIKEFDGARTEFVAKNNTPFFQPRPKPRGGGMSGGISEGMTSLASMAWLDGTSTAGAGAAGIERICLLDCVVLAA